MNTQIKPPILFILGPTASGKTEFACEVSELFPSEIISVDSAMVFKKMDIGTAKPPLSLLQKHPHHLINCIEPTDSFSAELFRNTALSLIESIIKKKKIPILVGGTLLYFKSLTEGLTPLPAADCMIRKQLDDEANVLGKSAMHDKLYQIDPITAKRLHPNDKQRIQRALEVFMLSGIPLSEHFAHTKNNVFLYKPIKITLFPEHRSVLHHRIENRFKQMIKQGFIDEVRHLKKNPLLDLSRPAMRCVGYRQIWSYLAHEYDLDTMINKGIFATRQLAKRQLTWLRSIEDNLWFNPQNDKQKTEAIHHILEKLAKKS